MPPLNCHAIVVKTDQVSLYGLSLGSWLPGQGPFQFTSPGRSYRMIPDKTPTERPANGDAGDIDVLLPTQSDGGFHGAVEWGISFQGHHNQPRAPRMP